MPVSSFHVGCLLQGIQFSCLRLNWDSVEENKVFILEIVSGWRKWPGVSFSNHWGPLWHRHIQFLCMLPESLCEFTCALVLQYVEGLLSMVSAISSGPYNLSTSSSEEFLWPWWEGFNRDIPLRTEFFKVSQSWHIVLICVSVCVFIGFRRKLP